MDVRVVVSAVGDSSEGLSKVSAFGLGADGDTDLTRGVLRSATGCVRWAVKLTSWDGGEGKSNRGEELLASLPQILNKRQV